MTTMALLMSLKMHLSVGTYMCVMLSLSYLLKIWFHNYTFVFLCCFKHIVFS